MSRARRGVQAATPGEVQAQVARAGCRTRSAAPRGRARAAAPRARCACPSAPAVPTCATPGRRPRAPARRWSPRRSSTTARCTIRPLSAFCTSTTRSRGAVDGDHALVGDLAAGLGVERRAVEHDLDRLPRLRGADELAVAQQAAHRRLGLELLVAGERRARPARAAAATPRCRRARTSSPSSRPSRARAAGPSACGTPPRRRLRPCSAAISSVSSIGKPYVSCSWNALLPGQLADPALGARCAAAVSKIVVPAASVRRNASSSA